MVKLDDNQPHSVEAEQGVLGSMLLSPRDVIAEAVEKINENYLYIPAHRTIYGVLHKMSGRPVKQST